MQTFNQRIDTANYRRETHDGKDWVIAPINILKPMVLNAPWTTEGAYLPPEEAEKSALAWNGEPLTLGHPSTADGNPTTANSPDMVEKTRIGKVYNAKSEDGFVKGEAWFDVKRIRDMGGLAEQALDAVLNGDSVDVSSGYLADKINRNIDGHKEVQGNIRPDHVAVLPDDEGKCSVEHGCGVGAVAANNLVVTNMRVENYLESARTPEYDGTETSSWGDVPKTLSHWTDALEIDADTVADMSAGEKQEIANHTLLGDPEADSWQELLFFPAVNPVTKNLNAGALRSILSGRGESQTSVPEEAEKSAQEEASSLLDEEFDSDNSGHMDEEMADNSLFKKFMRQLREEFGGEENANEPAESGAETTVNETDITMGDKTEELVENHGFEAENLPDEDTDCFDAIYNAFEGKETETEEESTEMSENAIVFESEEAFEEKVSEVIANRQKKSTKEELAGEIVANSEEYEDTDSVLEDYPTEAALQTKKQSVTKAEPDFSGTRGASARPATNTEDTDGLVMFGSDYGGD